MPRPISAQSDQDDNSDALLSEEYERLNNQLRTLQNDQRKQTEDTNVKLNKYKKSTEMLEKENNEILCLLSLVDSAQNRKNDMKCIERLRECLNQQEHLQVQYEELKTYEKRLNNEIRKLEKLLQEKQLERGAQAKKETEKSELLLLVEKKILAMENNLHEKNTKFCETLAKNASLRDQIEKLRNERKIYGLLYQKLQEKLRHLNNMKTKLTQYATAAYDLRTDAKNKANIIKEKNEKDNTAYEIEIKDLQRIIDHNNQLRKFMTTKSDERFEWKREAEERRKRYGSTGEIARHHRSQKIEEYTKAMEKLKAITNKEEVEQMIRYYKRNEDDNFTMFKYVTELNHEIEDLNDSILNKHKTIQQIQEEQVKLEQNRHSKIRELEIKINRDKDMADTNQLHVLHIHKVLDEVKTQIKQLTNKLGCNVTKIVGILGGDGDQVTERNLILFLSVLEQRVDELLTLKNYTQIKDYPDETSQDETKGIATPNFLETPKTNKDLLLNLPSLRDDDDDLNDEETHSLIRPFTQVELIKRITKDLQQLENKMDTNIITGLASSIKYQHRISSPTRRIKVK